MTMDVEVDYSGIQPLIDDHGLEPDAARAAALQSFVGHLERTARESVQALGQKWKACSVDRAGEWPQCKVRFEADSEAEAQTAWTLWAERVSALSGSARIVRSSLRGGDGTNLQYVDEGYETGLRDFRPLPGQWRPTPLSPSSSSPSWRSSP
jgi:hypothetical protein